MSTSETLTEGVRPRLRISPYISCERLTFTLLFSHTIEFISQEIFNISKRIASA
jgi:hypothetical protein